MNGTTIENIIEDGKITKQRITVPASVTECVYAAEAILDAMSTCGLDNCNHVALTDIALRPIFSSSALMSSIFSGSTSAVA